MPKIFRATWLLVVLIVFAFAWRQTSNRTMSREFDVVAPLSREPVERPVFDVGLASSGRTPAVHSASAVELRDGRIRAFWYGGTREGAKDVAIYSAVFDPRRTRFGAETVVVTRHEAASDLNRYIKKLGNPVASIDHEGRVWLFYVSVSVGGWSGASISVCVSDDDGASFGPSKRLVTSPFLNVSTLVKGPTIGFGDETMGLPIYHEFVGKFAELLRVDSTGRVLDKQRLTWGRSSLQPVVVPLDSNRAIAFMRTSGNGPRRILHARTSNGGRSFAPAEPMVLENPDAAVAAIRTREGEIVIAFNDSAADRENLSLAVSDNDGDSWEIVHVFEPPVPDGTASPRFGYPWLLQSRNGELHLLYTWNRERIAHARFNRAWLLRHRGKP